MSIVDGPDNLPPLVRYRPDGTRIEDAPKGELDRLEAIGKAWEYFYATGERTPLVVLGLLPAVPRGIHRN